MAFEASLLNMLSNDEEEIPGQLPIGFGTPIGMADDRNPGRNELMPFWEPDDPQGPDRRPSAPGIWGNPMGSGNTLGGLAGRLLPVTPSDSWPGTGQSAQGHWRPPRLAIPERTELRGGVHAGQTLDER